jgi:hypothetical protein
MLTLVVMVSTIPSMFLVYIITLYELGVAGLRTNVLNTSWFETDAETKLLTFKIVKLPVVLLEQFSLVLGFIVIPLMTWH